MIAFCLGNPVRWFVCSLPAACDFLKKIGPQELAVLPFFMRRLSTRATVGRKRMGVVKLRIGKKLHKKWEGSIDDCGCQGGGRLSGCNRSIVARRIHTMVGLLIDIVRAEIYQIGKTMTDCKVKTGQPSRGEQKRWS